MFIIYSLFFDYISGTLFTKYYNDDVSTRRFSVLIKYFKDIH